MWIIALFIALSEATAGVAAITTSGSARLIFACFAVAFPTLVFVVFIWLLVKHAPKLYAPGQYSSDITPEVYRTGISRADTLFLGRAVAKTVAPLLGGADGGEAAQEAVVEQVARRFEAAVEESIVEVNLFPLTADSEPLQIPATRQTQVDQLLDKIWWGLRPRGVRAFTFGTDWSLRNSSDGTEYTDVGTAWAKRNGLDRDTRPIGDVGITPGSHLDAIVKSDAKLRPYV